MYFDRQELTLIDSLRGGDSEVGSFLHGGTYLDLEAGVGDNLAAFFDVGAFEAEDDRQLHVQLLRCGDDCGSENVDAQNAAEDVDEDRLNVRVGEKDAEGVFDLLLVGAAAYVEEVCGLAAGVLDDVHRRHGEAGAVDHAGDGAVELDVVERVL